MIANDNGKDYALITYGSVMIFLADIYGINKESNIFGNLQEQIVKILEKDKIDYREHELKVAIIVFAIIESIQSDTNLNNSLNLLGTTLKENNIITAIELEYFLGSESEDLKLFKQIIKGRSKEKFNTNKLSANIYQNGKTIIVEQGNCKVKITD